MLILMTLCTSPIHAITHVFSFHNNSNVSAGGLSISLEQYHLDRDGKRIKAQSKSVLPGEEVSYIPVIKNNGADCYVRLRIRVEMDDEEIKRRISLDDIYGRGKCWKEIGDYLYYTKILQHGESIDAFQGIQIPYVWTQRAHESSGFTMYAYADAIQSTDYTPDFRTENPWKSGSVKTGDNSMYRLWTALLITMIAIAVYCSRNRMR